MTEYCSLPNALTLFFLVQLTQVLHVTTGGAVIMLLFTECQNKMHKDPNPVIIILGILKFCVNQLKHSEDQMPAHF